MAPVIVAATLTRAEYVDFNLFCKYRRSDMILGTQLMALILLIIGGWLVFDSHRNTAVVLAALAIYLIFLEYVGTAVLYALQFQNSTAARSKSQWTIDADGLLAVAHENNSSLRTKWDSIELAQDLGDFYFLRGTARGARRVLIAKRGFASNDDKQKFRQLLLDRTNFIVRHHPVVVGRAPKQSPRATEPLWAAFSSRDAW